MELEQLRHLDAIARCGSLQKASEQLHLSQSALSRSLRRLEADLGQELFDRTRNSMRLNAKGALALEHARTILAQERHLREDFDALARQTRTLRVCSVAPAPTWRISSLVLEQNPTTIVEPEILAPHDVEASLLNGTCDFAVTLAPARLPSVRSFELMHEDLYANVPAAHPLAARESTTFAELDGNAFLLYEQIGFWRDVHRRNLPNARFVVQPDRTIFLQQVRTSDLLAFTTNAPENTSAHHSRVAVPITDADAHATFHLCMRTDAPARVQALFAAIRG